MLKAGRYTGNACDAAYRSDSKRRSAQQPIWPQAFWQKTHNAGQYAERLARHGTSILLAYTRGGVYGRDTPAVSGRLSGLLGGSELAKRTERARRTQANDAIEAVKIDEIDRRILRALSDNGRMSISELSERVNLSSTPCWTRLKRLESSGIIDRYVALLDQRKLGLPDTVLIEITLDRHDEDVLDRFGKMLSEDPEILEAYLTTGGCDYIIKVAVEGTNGFERFLREKLYKMPGIRHTRSSFALRCLKHVHSVQPQTTLRLNEPKGRHSMSR